MIRRFLPAVLAAVVIGAGCTDHTQPLLAPSAPERTEVDLAAVDLDGVLEVATFSVLGGSRQAAKFIRADQGGFVELNGFRVDIPAGALPHDATITIDLPRGSRARYLIAEFGPHGIQFNEPVTLTFPLRGVATNGEGVGVARWENGVWTPLGGMVDQVGRSVSGTTPHFSTYGARKDVYPG
jgi:hypothetical protein